MAYLTEEQIIEIKDLIRIRLNNSDLLVTGRNNKFTTTTIEDLKSLLNLSTAGFSGFIDLDTPKSSEEIAFFIPTESGVYENFGGVVVDLSNGFYIIEKKGDNYDSFFIPIQLKSEVNNIEDLRLKTGSEGDLVTLLGYYEKGDKEPLNYKYTTEQSVDDGGSVINTSSGSWVAVFNSSVNVLDFGVKTDGVFDNKILVQNAINFSASKGYELVFPSGKIKTSGGWNFTSIKAISNSEPFGMIVKGQGMSTEIIIESATQQVLFDFYTSAKEIQVNLRDIFAYNIGATCIGLRLGRIGRYSTFENFRIYGFRRGHMYAGASYGVTFNNCYIRGCTNHSIYVDESALTSTGVLTEFRYTNCYIDNNGSALNTGTSSDYHINLFNCQEFTFLNTVIEGNYCFSVTIRGISEQIKFIGTRFEETLINTQNLLTGHIFNISSAVDNVLFIGGEFAYNNKGTDGNKNYSFLLCSSKKPVIFKNCQIIETSDTKPTNFLGASPLDCGVFFDDCSFGMRNEADPLFRQPILEKRRFAKRTKNGYIWNNADKLLFKETIPLNDNDGILLNSIKSLKTQNIGTSAIGVIGHFYLYIRDNVTPGNYLFGIGYYDGVNSPVVNVINSNIITITAVNNQGSINIGGSSDYTIKVFTLN